MQGKFQQKNYVCTNIYWIKPFLVKAAIWQTAYASKKKTTYLCSNDDLIFPIYRSLSRYLTQDKAVQKAHTQRQMVSSKQPRAILQRVLIRSAAEQDVVDWFCVILSILKKSLQLFFHNFGVNSS